ncbi:heat shock protein HspQ [Sphingomonas sp. CFBP 8760]|uniref:heat shock protein HspQ n=2 Tax=Sphingomonas sp. CFBP 8760 TaxID=2775282 RepID=UPI00177DFDEA|nr:heat shock protein HspQ [Sphingomonas sp. CFBP 8760]MBD8547134.1 heat shock protein HspQ [Sphingomonas sp. CFBP 8760]
MGMPRHVHLDRSAPSRPPSGGAEPVAPPIAHARFTIGDVVRHRMFDFRGVIFDIDPVFANTDEWYDAIPEGIRPRKDQPFYHLLAENIESSYVAYVSQQNLVPDDSDEPIDHPAIPGLFTGFADGRYRLRDEHRH